MVSHVCVLCVCVLQCVTSLSKADVRWWRPSRCSRFSHWTHWSWPTVRVFSTWMESSSAICRPRCRDFFSPAASSSSPDPRYGHAVGGQVADMPSRRQINTLTNRIADSEVLSPTAMVNSPTHTHLFSGPLSGTTRVSWNHKGKTNLDFIEARDSEWQWHQLGSMQVCTSLQTDDHSSTHHSVFYRPFLPPNQQHQRQWSQIAKFLNCGSLCHSFASWASLSVSSAIPCICRLFAVQGSFRYWHCSHSMRQGLCYGRVSVCLSVPSFDCCAPLVGLLLWARRAGDISEFLHTAATVSSVMLSADVGSWTQICWETFSAVCYAITFVFCYWSDSFVFSESHLMRHKFIFSVLCVVG